MQAGELASSAGAVGAETEAVAVQYMDDAPDQLYTIAEVYEDEGQLRVRLEPIAT